MRALKLLSWLFLRGWRRHPIRQGLSVLSIALGVALYLSTEITTGSIMKSLEMAQGALHTGIDLSLTHDAAGIPHDVVEALEARPEFSAVSGMVQVHALAPDGTTLTILGVDPARDAKLRRLEVGFRFAPGGPLKLASDPGAILLTEAGLEHLGLGLGDRLRLATASGVREFTIAGAASVSGPAREVLRDYGFLLLSTAQRLFSREGRVDRVDLALAPGVGRDAGSRAAREVAPGCSIATPDEAVQAFHESLSGFRAILIVNSLMALLVAVFFIYNTVSASVAERSRDAGLLRSVGLTRAGLYLLFLGEAAFAGVLGLASGALLGLALARGSLAVMVQTVGTLYFSIPPVSGITLEPSQLLEAAVLAIGVAGIASGLACHPLARRRPLEILRPALVAAMEHRRLVRLGWVGLGLFAAAVVLPFAAPRARSWPIGRLEVLLLPAGIALLAPALLLLVVTWLRRFVSRRARPALWLALDATRTHPARTAVTVTAFALSLGLVIGHGAMARAMIGTLSDWLVHTIPGDVIVGGNAGSPLSVFTFSEAALEPLHKLPGVDAVFRLRFVNVRLGQRTVACFALDLGLARSRARHEFLEGDPEDIFRRCIAGEAIFISDNLAWMTGFKTGDRVSFDGIDGPVELPIAGVLRDFNSHRGTVFMDLSLYRRIFKDPLLDFGELCLSPEARRDVAAVARAAQSALSPEYSFLRVTEKEAFVGQAMSVISDINNLSLVQIILSVVIGSVGILVTVTLSVLTRTRELSLLRALGMDGAGLSRTVLFEVLGLAAASAAAGLVIGNLMFLPANLLFRELSGFSFGHAFPVLHMGLALVVAFVTALASAVIPLRHVRRLEVLRAMEEE